MPTVNDENPFRIQDYMIHEDLQFMYPPDYEHVKKINPDGNLMLLKLNQTESLSGYRTVGKFLESCTTQELYGWITAVEDIKQHNNTVICAAMLAALEGETFIHWSEMNLYLKIFNFYLAICLIARSLDMKVKYEALTMSYNEMSGEAFKGHKVKSLFGFYSEHGPQQLILLLTTIKNHNE